MLERMESDKKSTSHNGKVCETVVRQTMLHGLETVAPRISWEAEQEVAEMLA